MDWREWVQETARVAKPPLDRALAAAEAGDGAACAAAAREAARLYLTAFLGACGFRNFASDDIMAAFTEVCAYDRYVARLRPEVTRLAGGPASDDCEAALEALKEVRLICMGRGGIVLGASMELPDADPLLAAFLVHSTTQERACRIFARGRLLSYNRCRGEGLISEPPPGVVHLLDPRRCLDYVMFGLAAHAYYAGEKVANAHRKGWIDESLEEDYQPSVRLFFRSDELRALPGYEDDGVFRLMVRDEVPLSRLAWAAFPGNEVRDAALASVAEAAARAALQPRCLVAPAEAIHSPRAYVAATNALVVQRERGART